MPADPFSLGFPQRLKGKAETYRRGRVGRMPVIVMVAGKYHAKVMYPDETTAVVNRRDVWIEGVDQWTGRDA